MRTQEVLIVIRPRGRLNRGRPLARERRVLASDRGRRRGRRDIRRGRGVRDLREETGLEAAVSARSMTLPTHERRPCESFIADEPADWEPTRDWSTTSSEAVHAPRQPSSSLCTASPTAAAAERCRDRALAFSEDVARPLRALATSKIWAIEEDAQLALLVPARLPAREFWAVEETTDDDIEAGSTATASARVPRDRDALARAHALGQARTTTACLPSRSTSSRPTASTWPRRPWTRRARRARRPGRAPRGGGNRAAHPAGALPLWDEVIATTLDYSGIRLRNAVRPMRILIAEDETIIRLDLRDLLERAGFEVVRRGQGRRGGGRARAPRSPTSRCWT